MMTLAQISAEVERLGYEYAEGIIGDSTGQFLERFNVQLDKQVLDKVDIDEFVKWVGSDGDAFPEQIWSWARCEEWIERDGTVKWIDEEGDEEDGTDGLFVDDWTAGIKRYIEEHFHTHVTVGSESSSASTDASSNNNINIKVLQGEDTDLSVGIVRASAKARKNPSVKFERARFHVDTGPASLF